MPSWSIPVSTIGGIEASSSDGAPFSSVTAWVQDVANRVITIRLLTTSHMFFFFISHFFKAILHNGILV
jgi:hypothetical protein